MDLYRIVLNALHAMDSRLAFIEEGETVMVAGTSGALTGDEDLKADFELGRACIANLDSSLIASVECEGLATHYTATPNAPFRVYVDPLDGSLYYKTRGAVRGFFPYGAAITVVRNVPHPTFDDVVAAGIINYVSGDVFSAMRNEDGTITSHLNDQSLAMPQDQKLDIMKRPLIGEMYYSGNRELMNSIFAGKNGYLRSVGCAAVEMAVVASGQISAFVCDRQKVHELGAAQLIVKGAGGVAVDFDGKDISKLPYVFNSQMPIVLTSRSLKAELVAAIKQAI
jgi:myo-inositol-1(or 4)-monophosphatase